LKWHKGAVVCGHSYITRLASLQAIDGRPHFAKRSIDDGKQEEIAAIDPEFEWGEAPVPDGMS
jgi:hypothetical protein